MVTLPSEFFLVARIGASDMLITLGSIREIVPAMQLATPRGVGGGCRGVANVRGEVVAVFDLLRREGPLDVGQMIVLTQAERNKAIGIVVDDVKDIVGLASAEVVQHPAGRGRYARTAVLHGEPLAVLTVSEILDAA